MHDWPFSKSCKKASAFARYIGSWIKGLHAPLPNPPGWHPPAEDHYELQALEPRLLLSASQPAAAGGAVILMSQETALSSAAVSAIKVGLGGVADFLTQASAVDKLNVRLPILDQSIGAALNPGAALRSALVDSVTNYLNTSGSPSVEGLRGVLAGLGNVAGLQVDVSAVTGTSSASEVLFGLTLNVTRALGAVPIQLGQAAQDLGLTLGADATVTPQSHLTFRFSFGFDQTAGIASEDAFFIRVAELANDVVISTAGRSFGLNVGLLAGTTQNAGLALTGKVALTIANPNNDAAGNITLKELRTTPLATLVAMTAPISTLTGNLPVNASFMNYTASGTPTLTISGNPLAGSLTVTQNSDFSELLNFSSLTASSVNLVLSQIATKLSQISASSLLGTSVPFLGGRTIGDIVDLGAMFRTAVVAPLTDANGAPTFTNLSGFTAALASALGVNQSVLNASYNAATNELSFQIAFGKALAPASFDVDLGAVIDGSAGLQGFAVLSDDSTATVNAQGDAIFKLVMNLTPPVATAPGSTALPANGRLTAAQTFSLGLNAGAPIVLTINPDATNNSAADLVADINTALNATALKGKVIATLQGGKLSLATTIFGGQVTLLVAAAANNELGLPTARTFTDSLVRHSSLESPALSAGVVANATSLNGTASIGYLGLLIRGGTAQSSATASLALKSSAGTRLALLDPNLADVTTLFNSTVGGSASASIPVKTNGRGFFETLSANAAANITWSNITSPATLGATFTAEFTPLRKFAPLTFTQIDAALTAVRDELDALRNLAELNAALPLTDDTLNTLVNLTPAFDAMLASLRAAHPRTIQDVQRLIDVAMTPTTPGGGTALLGASSVTVSYDAAAGVVFVDIGLVRNRHVDSTLSVDLLPLGAANVGVLSDALGTDKLGVDASAKFRAKLGIDLNGATPAFFLYDDSALEFGTKISNLDLDLPFVLGPLNFTIKDGVAGLDDGTPAKGPAKVSVTMTDRGANGRYALSEIDDNGVFNAATNGKVTAQLPVYENGGASYVGDLTMNATPNFFAANPFVGASAATANTLSQRIANSNPVNNVTTFNQGWQNFMGQLIGLANQWVNAPLAMVGQTVPGLNQFLTSVRDTVSAQLTSGAPATTTAIRQILFGALGPGTVQNPGLNWLGDINNSGGPATIDDVNLTLGASEFFFRMKLAPSLTINNFALDSLIPLIPGATAATAPLDFVNAPVNINFSASFDFAFGVSIADGFFLDTAVQDELKIALGVVFQPGADLQVTMNGVIGKMSLTQDISGDQTAVSFGLKVDLRDPIDLSGTTDHRLSFNDMVRYASKPDIISRTFNLKADADVHLRLQFQAGFQDLFTNPSMLVDFNFDWAFANVPVLRGTNLNTVESFLAATTVPNLQLKNFRIRAGSVFTDFVDPILKQMNSVLQPLRPLLDALNKKVDALNGNDILRGLFDINRDGTVRVLDLLRITSSLGDSTTTFDEAAFAFLDAVIKLDELVRSVPNLSQDLMINFGDLSIGTADLRTQTLREVLPTLINRPGLTPMQQLDAISGSRTFLQASLGITAPGEGFKYLLLDELNAGKMLFGQTIDIFSYDMPTLTAKIRFEQDVQIWAPPPVFLAFGAELSAFAHAKFGFDTSGLNGVGSPTDGFYIVADPLKPVFGLKGSIFAGVGVGISGAAEVRGEISFNAEANFTLNDVPDANGVVDGKLHLNEFGGAPTPFTISGKIYAAADVRATLLGTQPFRFDSPEYIFWQASQSIPKVATSSTQLPDRLEGNDTRATAAPVGLGGAVHLRGASIGKFKDVDWYSFDVVKGIDALDVKVTGAGTSAGDVDVEVYDSAGRSLGFARTNSASDVVALGNVAPGTYYARVFSKGAVVSYDLDIQPAKSSAVQVYFVSSANVTDPKKDSYYTTAPGDDTDIDPTHFIGKNYDVPLASVSQVFARYNVSINDLIAVDSGTYLDPAIVNDGDDEGFVLAGAPGFRTIFATPTGVALDITGVGDGTTTAGEGAVFTDLRFTGNETALHLDNSQANKLQRLDFATATTAIDLNNSSRQTFSGITIKNATTGVQLNLSNANTFTGVLSAVGTGLKLSGSDNNDFTGTTIAANVLGAALLDSDNTTLAQMRVESAGRGIRLTGSSTNTIDHTTIIAADTDLIIEPDGGTASTNNIVTNNTFTTATITAGNTLVQSNTIAGQLTLAGGALNQVRNNTINGGVMLNATDTAVVMTNTLTGGISIKRGSSNIIDGNTLTVAGISISGGDLLTVRNNTITNVSTAISVGADAATATLPLDLADGVIHSNTLTTGLRGISLDTSDNTGIEIRNNTIAGFTNYGVYAPANAALHDNQISGGGTGVFYNGTSNKVFANNIHHNQIGLSGDGLIGQADWTAVQSNDIHDNDIGIDAKAGTTVQFNRIRNNTIGIRAASNAIIHNNVLFGNTAQSILVSGGQNVSIVSNTIYAPAGDGVRIIGTSKNVSVQNNIVWAQGGYDLYVATDSQTGFASDYNNLFTSGAGKAVWYQKDFLDLFDWQVEADFDTHSIGFTTIAPTLDNPQFVNVATGDFRLTNLTSTSIDAADPLTAFALEPGNNGAREDLGAYGNTNLAATSRPAYLQMLYPTYYTDWEVGEGNAIRWRDYDSAGVGNRLTGTVGIELHKVGTGKIRDLGTALISDGTFSFTPDAPLADTNARYFIKLVPGLGVAPAETQRETFAVPIVGNDFYVDDASNTNDEYTPGAVGNNRSTGKTAGDPKANLLPIVHNYLLTANQTVRVDTGYYINVRDVRFSGDVAGGFGDDEGMTITGPLNPAKVATLDRAKAFQGAQVIELRDADLVTISHLTLIGAERGIWVHAGSENFAGSYLTVSGHVREGLLIGAGQYGYEQIPSAASSLSYLTAFNNGSDGIHVGNTTGALTYDNILVYNNQGHGFYAGSPVALLRNSIAHDNRYDGFNLNGYNNGGGVTPRIENNVAYNNQTGIYVGYDSIVGNEDLSLGRGNIAYNNRYVGISGNQVLGNTVYGQTGNSGIGISAFSARNNVVFGNFDGIRGTYASANRVYANSGVGITVDTATGNVVYSNTGGVSATHAEGNVVYANSSFGIRVIGAYSQAYPTVQNNTVYQTTGDAVVVGSSRNVAVRNNILWAENGLALNLDAASQLDFKSDFNLFYATSASGKIGTWQGAARTTLAQWKNATFGDKNSLFADPLFVDRDGADNKLGYFSAAQDGRDDDFHLQSTFGSIHGGTFAPVLGGNGLPAGQNGTLTTDAAQSPGIDRADFTRPFANEPVNNGGYADLGAFGNTTQSSLSPAQYVLVTSPNGGDVFPRNQTFAINWRSHDTKHNQSDPPAANNTVTIALLKNGTLVQTLASAEPNDGQFLWTVPDNLATGADYSIRVTHTVSGKVDTSDAVFEVTPAISIYYVNDGTAAAGDWTTAAGDDSNDGLTPATPKANIRAVLEAYDLGPNDIIRVDAGTFDLTQNIIITNEDSGVTITGFLDAAQPTKKTIINRNLPSTYGANAFELQNADNVTLTQLGITGSYTGIYAAQSYGDQGSTGFTLRDSEIFANYNGLELQSGNDGATLLNNDFHGDGSNGYGAQYTGATVGGSGSLISSNVFHSRSRLEIRGLNVIAESNDFYDGAGITTSSASYGSPLDGTIIRNNTVRDGNGSINVSAGVLVENNTLFNLTGGTGISAAGNQYARVRVLGNTIHNISGQGIGIYAGYNTLVRGNTIYDSVTGIQGSGLIENNRVFHNTGTGIDGGGQITGNVVYSNAIGIESAGGTVANNLIYANATTGLELGSSVTASNNTIHQPTGSAVKVAGYSNNVTLRNNILSTGDAAGTAIFVETTDPVNFASDYNIFTGPGAIAKWLGAPVTTQTQWSLEIGFDRHSILGNPGFIDVDGADNVLGYTTLDGGADDNFRLIGTSVAIDAADPDSPFLAEPAPNGGRADIGYTGNSALANLSAAQTVQILGPAGLDRLIAGRAVSIDWRSSGLALTQSLLRTHPGSDVIAGWSESNYLTSSPYQAAVTGAVDLSNVTNPAPAEVYASYWSGRYDSSSGETGQIQFSVPVPDGVYTLRLHFAEVGEQYAGGQRKMDIIANGTTLATGFNIQSEAGGRLKAIAKTYTVTAANGGGIDLNLIGTNNYALLSGLEVTGVNTGGSANATVNLEVSTNSGASWSPIASNLPLGADGVGSYAWTPDASLAGANALLRIKANTGAQPTGLSDRAFAIAAAGNEFFVNNAIDAADIYTTAAGSNEFSGRDRSHPMASISALLEAYDLQPGDTIYVDAGTYTLATNIVITADDAGIRIVGAPNFATVLNRNAGPSASTAYAIELRNADNVELTGLKITGAKKGIFAADKSDSDGVKITGNLIFENDGAGIELGPTNDNALITGNTLFGRADDNNVANSNYANDQNYGIQTAGLNATIRGNTIYQVVAANSSTTYSAGIGIDVNGGFALVENNTVRNYSTGISSSIYGTVAGQTVIRGNDVSLNNSGITASLGRVLITENTVHDNTSSGIYSYNSQFGSAGVIVENNTVFGQDGQYGQGIVIGNGVIARGNTIFGNTVGVFASGGEVRGNRVFGNTLYGVQAINDAAVNANAIYSNATGVFATYYLSGNYPAPYFGTIANNVIYDSSVAGIDLKGADGAKVLNNTIHQAGGIGVKLSGEAFDIYSQGFPYTYLYTREVPTTNLDLRNNIFSIGTGVAIVADNFSQRDIRSDYNLFSLATGGRIATWQGVNIATKAQWFYEVGQDEHSLVGAPGFVNPAGPDGLLGFRNGNDFGADDNFHVTADSITVDAGDPASYYSGEPTPNGDRVNLGRYGNTLETPASDDQSIAILSPGGFAKLEAGVPATIRFATSGLIASKTFLRMNAGGGAVGVWGYNAFQTTPGYPGTIYDYNASQLVTVNTSGVVNPAPQGVYQSYASSTYGVGNALSYHLDLPNGSYSLRLHFVEPEQGTSLYHEGTRVFDIVGNGQTIEEDFDIFARAGGGQKALAETFNIVVNGGNGFDLSLVNKTQFSAVLAGLEITRDNPLGSANPTVNAEFSNNSGSSWTSIAANITLDAEGNGSLLWTPPAALDGQNVLIRVTANNAAFTDTTSMPFAIVNNGANFYLNDGALTGDLYTTAIGLDANSGKDAAHPMRTLAALLEAYDLGAGDKIFVDAGTYALLRNVTIGADDSGVEIVGPTSGVALFSRGNTDVSTARGFEIAGGTNVTIGRVSVTGAHTGLYAGSGSTGLLVKNSAIFGNYRNGVIIDSGATGATIRNATIYGVPGGAATDNQDIGVLVRAADATIENSTIRDHAKYGVSFAGNNTGDMLRGRIIGNTVSGNADRGISVSGYVPSVADGVTISGNTVFNNAKFGIYSDTFVSIRGNNVHDQLASDGIGISLSSGEARDNVVTQNTTGIKVTGGYYTANAVVANNRVFANTTVGIDLNGGTLVGNQIYSNSIGVQAQSGALTNNVIYANSNHGVVIPNGSATLTNNTIRQVVGDAVRTFGTNTSGSATLRNNILWVDAGYAINLGTGSAVISDYNVFNLSTAVNARIGYSGNANRDTLADWRTATSQDAHSFFGDPKFIDADGADNVLGYTIISGNPVDGGFDDNFHLGKNSPAIDRGDALLGTGTDREGITRRDDPGAVNTGSADYVTSTPANSAFTKTGTQLNFYSYSNQPLSASSSLNFSFPFFGQSFGGVAVSLNGFISFAGTEGFDDTTNTSAELAQFSRIAPLWDDLSTGFSSRKAFEDSSVTGQHTIRWEMSRVLPNSTTQELNFSVTLFASGDIRFNYGDGLTGLTPTIGISNGNGLLKLAANNGAASIATGTRTLFALTPGASVTDIGAHEFAGSSNDATVPTVTSTVPSAIASGGFHGVPFDRITVKFSEIVDNIDARSGLNYALVRDSDANGTFNGTDEVFPLTPQHTPGSDTVTLVADAGILPVGVYRLTIAGSTIHDTAGNLLAQYQKTFTVNRHGVEVSTTALNVNENGTAQFGVRLRELPAGNTTVTVALSGDSNLSITGTTQFTFTTANWNVFQNVTVAAANDIDADNGTATITASATGWTTDTLTASEADDDRILQLSANTLSVSEQGYSTQSVGVRLAAQPSSEVIVTVRRTGGDTDLAVFGNATLVFTPQNWDTFQQVAITAANDIDAIDSTATFVATATGWTSAGFTATEADNDRSIQTSVGYSSLDVTKGSTATYGISLAGQPAGNVTVNTARIYGTAGITLTGGATLTFTPENWNVEQTVTVQVPAGAQFRQTETFQSTATDWANATATLRVYPPAGTIVIDANRAISLSKDASESYLGISDPERSGGGALTIVIDQVPAHVKIRNGFGGSIVTTSSTLYSYEFYNLTAQPDAGYLGAGGDFKYTVTDANNQSVSQTITFDVTRYNRAPIVPGSFGRTFEQNSGGGSLNLFQPNDPDSDPFTITVTQIPDGTKGDIRVTFNGAPLAVGATLTPLQVSQLYFNTTANGGFGAAGAVSFKAVDSLGAEATTTITFTITQHINNPPYVQADKTLRVPDTGDTTLGIFAPYDYDNDALTVAITAVPLPTVGVVKLNGATLTTQSVITSDQLAQLVFTPAAGSVASSGAFTYSVSDASSTSSQTLTIQVAQAVTFDKTHPLAFTDSNGDKLVLTLAGSGSGRVLFSGTNGASDIDTVLLANTTSASGLKLVFAKISPGDLKSTIGHILTTGVEQSLGKVELAKGITLGDGTIGGTSALFVSGGIGTLTLDDVAANADIRFGTDFTAGMLDDAKDLAGLKPTITLGDVGNNASISSTGGIGKMKIGSWTNGYISARLSIGTVTVAGDFGASIYANDYVQGGTLASVGAVNVAGNFNGRIFVEQSLTSLTVKGAITSGAYLNGVEVGAVTAGNFDGGTFNGSKVGILTATAGGMRNVSVTAGFAKGLVVKLAKQTSATIYGLSGVTVRAGQIGSISSTIKGIAGMTGATAIRNSTFTATGAGGIGDVTATVDGLALDLGTGIDASTFTSAGKLGKITATASSAAAITHLTGVRNTGFSITGDIAGFTAAATASNATPNATQSTTAGLTSTGSATRTISGGAIGSVIISAQGGGTTNEAISTQGTSRIAFSAGTSITGVTITAAKGKATASNTYALSNVNLTAGTTIGKIVIGGDATATQATDLRVWAGGAITSLAVSSKSNTTFGSLVNSTVLAGQNTAIALAKDIPKASLGAITIGGSVTGVAGAPTIIAAKGNLGAVIIGGGVQNALFIAGASAGSDRILGTVGDSYHRHASILSVKVAGAFTASTIAAGIDPGADFKWGGTDDLAAATIPLLKVGKIGAITLGSSTVAAGVSQPIRSSTLGAHDFAIESLILTSVQIGKLPATKTFSTTASLFIDTNGDAQAQATETRLRLFV